MHEVVLDVRSGHRVARGLKREGVVRVIVNRAEIQRLESQILGCDLTDFESNVVVIKLDCCEFGSSYNNRY